MNLIAFKTYSQAPQNQKPAGMPDEWPWIVTPILQAQQTSFVASGFQVMTQQEFNQYKQQFENQYHAWANQFDIDRAAQELRVLAIVEEQFVNFHPSKIDFRRHLKPNIYLQKNVTILPNGRPDKAIYFHEGVLIAEIKFEFEVDQFNFMTRRRELLSYYQNNNQPVGPWVIADDTFDPANPYQLREIMRERSESRRMIIEEIKAFLNGVLAQVYLPQGKTYLEILEIAGVFWKKYSTPIDSWVNVGAPQFKTMLEEDTEFDFLNVVISPNVTVRSFILAKTSY